MLKRILLSSAALALLAGSASAADLSTRMPVKAVVMPAPAFSWTGFYIGGNAGLGVGDFKSNSTLVDDSVAYPFSSSLTASGAFVGGQLGYNYQFVNNVVLGIETDLQWSNVEGKWRSGFPVGNFFPGNLENKASLDYFGTIRARLGYAFDRVLPYVTGGAAYGKIKADQTSLVDSLFAGEGYANSNSTTNWGWTIGAGVEYAMTNNWTLKVEYLYMDLGDLNRTIVGDNASLSNSTSFELHTLKAGINYKF